MFIGHRPFYAVSSHKVGSEVLKDPRFLKAPQAIGPLSSVPGLTALRAVIGDALPIMDEGALERRQILAPLFVDAHRALADADDGIVADRLDAIVAEEGRVSDDGAVDVDLYGVVARLVVEGIVGLFCGDRCEAASARLRDVIDAGNVAVSGMAQSPLPWALRWPLPMPKALEETRAQLLAFAVERDAAMGADARFAQVTGLERAVYLDEIITQLVAGTETTALSVCWSIQWLMREPQWLPRLRACPRAALPTLGGDDDTSLFLREALRLSPPFWQTPRTASEDLVVDDGGAGFAVEAGAFVMVCIALCNRDPIYGDDADAFRPDRPRAGLPPPLSFGVGPRSCIGGRASIVTAHRVLSALLARYTVALTPTEAKERPLIFGLKREGGFMARLKERA